MPRTAPRAAILLRLVAALSLLALPGMAAEPSCSPPPEVQAIVERSDALFKECGLSDECFAKRHALLSEALADQPHDVFLHRVYQNLFLLEVPEGWREEQDGLEARYRARAEAAPADPVARYLAARVMRDRQAAVPQLRQALELKPELPQVHLALVQSLSGKKDPDSQQEAWQHLWEWVRLCPRETADALPFAARLADRAQQARLAARAREVAPELPGEDALGLYNFLWDLEFRAAAIEDHAAVRQRIAADLVVLDTLGIPESQESLEVLAKGHELAGEAAQAEALRERAVALDPCTDAAAYARSKRWTEEHPPPAPSAKPDERQTYARLAYAEADSWVKRCPQQLDGHIDRTLALGEHRELSAEQIHADLDESLAAWDRGHRGRSITPPFEQLVAQMLIEREIELDRVPALLAAARKETAERSRRDLERLGSDPAQRERFAQSQDWLVWQADELAVQALVAGGRLDEAAAALDELSRRTAETAPAATASEQSKQAHDFRLAELARMRARLTDKQGHGLDALALYRRAMSEYPDHRGIANEARALWDRLGGSEEGWLALGATAAAPAAGDEMRGWERKDRELPALRLSDLSGKVWTSADLAGKVVLVNLWATWCGPCQMELPHIQKLAEETAGDPSVLVLTLNVDQNPGLVAPFVAKKGFTMPVLLGYDYANSVVDQMAIPRNWLLRGDRLELEQVGFSVARSEQWLNELRQHFAAARQASPEGKGAGK